MASKITWAEVYKDFKSKFPRLKNEVIHYQPYNYLKIILTLKDGKKMVYDYMTRSCEFVA